MNSRDVATWVGLILPLLSPVCIVAQVTVSSVLVTGTATTTNDSASFSVDAFTERLEASSMSGQLLNSSIASVSASARAGANLSFDISSDVRADQFSTPWTASGTAVVEILFDINSNYEVSFSQSAFGSNANFGFTSSLSLNEFAENTLTRIDDNTVLDISGEYIDFQQSARIDIGPGAYLLRSETSTFAGDQDISGDVSSFATIRFVAVPEPSSILLTAGLCAGLTLKRRRWVERSA